MIAGQARAAQPSGVAVEQAQRVLASHIGPIARIVAKKAAAHATTREQFYGLLCAELGSEAERGKVMAELAKIP